MKAVWTFAKQEKKAGGFADAALAPDRIRWYNGDRKRKTVKTGFSAAQKGFSSGARARPAEKPAAQNKKKRRLKTGLWQEETECGCG